jgi:hypothetical protein
MKSKLQDGAGALPDAAHANGQLKTVDKIHTMIKIDLRSTWARLHYLYLGVSEQYNEFMFEKQQEEILKRIFWKLGPKYDLWGTKETSINHSRRSRL